MIKSEMPSILIQLDEPTLKALDRIAPATQRKRAEFVRKAIREAIRHHQFERIEKAY
ncbi:MAG: ribbon-helix-helix protein, CopG family [Bryobacterales bacterium]|nr:ribbon-helix-helix protein, CopG family [Bryobacterales bacterium]